MYVLCTEFPKEPIVIKGIKTGGKVSLLGFEGKVKSEKSGDTFIITPPVLLSQVSPNNYAWVFKIENGAQ